MKTRLAHEQEGTGIDTAGHRGPANLPPKVIGSQSGPENFPEPEAHPFADEADPLESAYAFAIGEAAKAGQWEVIQTIVNELRARREWTAERERAEKEEQGGKIVPFRPKA